MSLPNSRCRITAASLSETLDTKGPFAAEDARRMAELDAAMAGDPAQKYVDGWRNRKARLESTSPSLETLRVRAEAFAAWEEDYRFRTGRAPSGAERIEKRAELRARITNGRAR